MLYSRDTTDMLVATARVRLPVSDEDLRRIGEENPGWKVELVDGAIEMTPVLTESGRQNAKLTYLLFVWGERHGFEAFDSSTGFRVSKRDVLVPDSALIRKKRWAALSQKERESYTTLVPDVVVELASKSDSREAARQKCKRWHKKGAAYVILLDPKAGSVQTWGAPPDDFPRPETLLDEIVR